MRTCEPPLHVHIVAMEDETVWKAGLVQARDVIMNALDVLDSCLVTHPVDDGTTRTMFATRTREDEVIAVRTDIDDRNTGNTETSFLRTEGDTVHGVTLQCPLPLRRIRNPTQGVRITGGIALRIIEAALADDGERMRVGQAAASLTEAIGRRVCEVQEHDDLESVSIRLPSPFDLPGCRAWNGASWEETLDGRHDVWRLVDAVSVILRPREDGTLLMHVSTKPTEQPDPDLGPLDAMRALASLPPAPAPRCVTGDQTPT